jgi:signal transduction histidine kinase
MRLPPISLRRRLLLGAVVVGVTFAVVFGTLAAWRVHVAEDRALHAALSSRLDLARDEVGGDGTLRQDAGSPKTDLVQVVGPDGHVRASSPALSDTRPLVNVREVRRSAAGLQRTASLAQPDIDLKVLAVPLKMSPHGSSPGGTGALAVAVDVAGFDAVTSDLLVLLALGLLAVVLAIAGLSWVLTGRALRSVTVLTESAEHVGARDLAAGLPVPDRDVELGRLVAALNRMLARIDAGHATELAFAADAGHRLRTPVATLRAEAELAQREPDPHEQAAALARIVDDADRLTSIVDRMLARSRFGRVAPEPVLSTLAAATPRWQRQAELAGVSLRVNGTNGVRPDDHATGLVEVLEPIVENAVRHTSADGSVTIKVTRRHDTDHDEARHVVVVDVANTGSPVPADLAPHMFDPWVSDRDASVAGGLGLWLSRETARDAGGDVSLHESRDGCTSFRVVLPVSH